MPVLYDFNDYSCMHQFYNYRPCPASKYIVLPNNGKVKLLALTLKIEIIIIKNNSNNSVNLISLFIFITYKLYAIDDKTLLNRI